MGDGFGACFVRFDCVEIDLGGDKELCGVLCVVSIVDGVIAGYYSF